MSVVHELNKVLHIKLISTYWIILDGTIPTTETEERTEEEIEKEEEKETVEETAKTVERKEEDGEEQEEEPAEEIVDRKGKYSINIIAIFSVKYIC